ncbi:MAG: T9SS type A sorting domain-containing protein, partial [Ignavibacteriales bacterium]|nr:T9SS type A sorting domain-containing protein [Ignavibacteriales bacterium]
VPPSTRSTSDPKGKLWNFVFVPSLNAHDSVHVFGFARTTRDQKITKYYWTRNNIQVGSSRHDAGVTSVRKLPMPNRINGLYEAFADGGFGSTNGLLVGKNRSVGTDSSKFYGWLLAPLYTDVLKSLRDKTGLHTGDPYGFDRYTSSHKPIVKQQRTMPPSKNNNTLLSDMIALNLNITMSVLGITPVGFGELIYDDNSGNPWNAMMIKDIATFADSLMMGYYDAGLHTFTDSITFRQLDSAIQKINCAFEGPLDTISFANQLNLRGTHPLIETPYLRANPNVIPERIISTSVRITDLPATYALYQNYPNPFNPTTTIKFDLPNPSSVTLSMYNILGQEVERLLDHEVMEDGSQEVELNASHLASGVYFYRIIADEIVQDDADTPATSFVSVKKMVLVK